ncbi:LacI family DNA-binding transcriptional regulator [Brevibacterium casei]|uniref:LacI family DNA-binding transcriptional regulator n=1 Tax=Brevibacterium casei TaxID=33889 RepID=UPI0021B001FC|nr:LacI family DNA-binding transcriptional regulator [Brevibacterium casei]MCT1446178.1 LacI family DNA-binding transcriptional regulator [Brevibacterium casei]
MTRLRITHSGPAIRQRVLDLVDHHGTIKATAAAAGISTDTLSRILRHERATVQEPTYQAILRAHRAMQRAQTVDGGAVANFATTAEGQAYIERCRLPRNYRLATKAVAA